MLFKGIKRLYNAFNDDEDSVQPIKLKVEMFEEKNKTENSRDFTESSPERKDNEEEKGIYYNVPQLRKIYSDQSPTQIADNNGGKLLDSIDEQKTFENLSHEQEEQPPAIPVNKKESSKNTRKISDMKHMDEDTDEEIIDTTH
uniref:Uncharacterized protein n=1 Tax=Euplotes harpa TaxID=151035 RepID=A0A7S3JCZ3_9SPIT|mmetsp:Transcript_33111/g.38041  ORF Transcript_33111/g.38041 Transcript_33111/m.38041 type:complete len:143 (+) Transcript_33111:53-481(+)